VHNIEKISNLSKNSLKICASAKYSCCLTEKNPLKRQIQLSMSIGQSFARDENGYAVFAWGEKRLHGGGRAMSSQKNGGECLNVASCRPKSFSKNGWKPQSSDAAILALRSFLQSPRSHGARPQI
jgi:hypothetical protein